MRGLTHGGVIHVEVAADRADHDFARVKPDADVHGVAARDAGRVASHGVLHPERRVARPHGVILVCERGAEQGHDPVAHDLVHRPLVPVDGLHHPLQDGVEKLARLLGVAISKQFHRPFQVSEEDRDLLALAL